MIVTKLKALVRKVRYVMGSIAAWIVGMLCCGGKCTCNESDCVTAVRKGVK